MIDQAAPMANNANTNRMPGQEDNEFEFVAGTEKEDFDFGLKENLYGNQEEEED